MRSRGQTKREFLELEMLIMMFKESHSDQWNRVVITVGGRICALSHGSKVSAGVTAYFLTHVD